MVSLPAFFSGIPFLELTTARNPEASLGGRQTGSLQVLAEGRGKRYSDVQRQCENPLGFSSLSPSLEPQSPGNPVVGSQ